MKGTFYAKGSGPSLPAITLYLRSAPQFRSLLSYSKSDDSITAKQASARWQDPRQGGEETHHMTTVLFVCVTYSVISLLIVYLNWWVFTVRFQFPVFVSWIQQVVGLCLSYFLAFVGNSCDISALKMFPLESINFKTAVKVAPVTLSFVWMVATSNICLKYAQVSTYQTARSLTLVFVATTSYCLLGERISLRCIMALAVISSGFVLCSSDPTALAHLGVIFGLLSSVFHGFYLVGIKKRLVHVGGNANRLLIYNLIMSSLLLLLATYLFGEWNAFYQLPMSISDESFFSIWIGVLSSGVLATFLNLFAFLCIKMTSPLTFEIVTIVKAVIQSLGGIVFLNDCVSVLSMTGIILTLSGTACYSHLKLQEQRDSAAPPAVVRNDDVENRGGMSDKSQTVEVVVDQRR